MKKYFIQSLTMTLVVLMFFALSSTKGKSSSLSQLANIEALESKPIKLLCYNTISTIGSSNLTHVTYCPDCQPHLARVWSNADECEFTPPPN